MGWKNWPYWLKGGAIGGIIVILFTIILFIFGGDYRYSPDQMVPKWTLVITYPLGFLVKVSEFIDLNTNLHNFYKHLKPLFSMKGILVVIDGLGDLPNRFLGDKTPLEAANTPNMDFLATRGELGRMDTVKPGYIPGSDEGIVSLFGNDSSYVSRGVLEAVGAGLKVVRGDLCLRTNFATINNLKERNIIDRRCGRTLTTHE